jgi:hypothetical protein
MRVPVERGGLEVLHDGGTALISWASILNREAMLRDGRLARVHVADPRLAVKRQREAAKRAGESQ